eukprot:357938-Chlamydomonas_euryale.AAC.3
MRTDALLRERCCRWCGATAARSAAQCWARNPAQKDSVTRSTTASSGPTCSCASTTLQVRAVMHSMQCLAGFAQLDWQEPPRCIFPLFMLFFTLRLCMLSVSHAGNYYGQFQSNVLPPVVPISSCPGEG